MGGSNDVSGFAVLGLFLLLALLFIAALIYFLILLAIQYWYISVPIIALITYLVIRRRKNKKQRTAQQEAKDQKFRREYSEDYARQERQKYRYRWGRDRSSSHYDNPYDDEFWKEDFGKDEQYWFEDEEFWDRHDPKGFYDRRGDYYHQKKKWEKDYEEAKRNFEEAKKQWEEYTGRKYTEDWYKDFDWDDLLERKTSEEALKKAYKTLGLKANSTISEVKKKFRELTLKHHPDKCKNKKAAEKKFKKILTAYETIKENTESTSKA